MFLVLCVIKIILIVIQKTARCIARNRCKSVNRVGL
jgi:hypothetical protein